MCDPAEIPGAGPGRGEGGLPRGKQSTKRWYDDQAKKGGWFFRSLGYRTLRLFGPVQWFKWVFLQLDQHEASCRWRKLCYLGRSS
jgi:hypothetical protein